MIAAVSGGVDSIVLLDVLAHLCPRLGHALAVAHCCHWLRGEESRRDLDFVRQAAGRVNSELHVIECPLDGHSSGIQEKARQLRRAGLVSLVDEMAPRFPVSVWPGGIWICTAHHMDDQAETVIFRLGRGTGPAGLAGIPLISPPFIRPLLTVRREEILACSTERNLSWVEDSSNSSGKYTRNRLRQSVLPALESSLGFDPVPGISALTEEMAAWSRIFKEWCVSTLCSLRMVARFHGPGGERPVSMLEVSSLLKTKAPLCRTRRDHVAVGSQIAPGDPDEGPPRAMSLDRAALSSMDPRVRQALMGFVVASFGADPSRRKMESISRMVDSFCEKRHEIAPGQVIEAHPRRIFIGDESLSPLRWCRYSNRLDPLYPIEVCKASPTGRIEMILSGMTVELSRIDCLPVDFRGKILDCRSSPVMKPRDTGDRARLGRGPSRSVKKILSESRIPSAARDFIPLMAVNGEVVWIPFVEENEAVVQFHGRKRGAPELFLIRVKASGGWNEF